MQRILGWLREHASIGPLLVLGLLSASVLAFLGLLDEVREGETEAFDTEVVLLF